MPPFSTTPVATPRPVEGHLADSQAKAMTARERAIAKLTAQAEPSQAPGASVQDSNPPKNLLPPTPESVQAPETEGQTPISEASTSVETPTEATISPPEAPLSSQYAQLARKEKAIRMQAQELKRQQDAFRQREDAIKAKEAEMQSNYVPKERLVKDPWSVLNENNVSYEQITQEALNAPSPEQRAQQQIIAELRSKIQALEDGQTSFKKSSEEAQKQAYTQAVGHLKAETKALVASGDAFETIRVTNSHDDVVDLITKTFEKEGVLLTVEDAATAVEDYLIEEAMKVARLAKIQARLQPKAASPSAPEAKAGAPGSKPPMKTLTNATGAARQLTAKERAVMAFKGEKV